MADILFERVAILGLGLIGSYLARALYENGTANNIAAYDISEATLDYALKEKFTHSGHTHAIDAVKNADLVIFATPPLSFAELAQTIVPFLKKYALITDVASVKQFAVDAIAPLLPTHAYYVPSHPIAGSEKKGAHAGNANLFFGKKTILTPAENDVLSEPVTRIKILWESVGAKIDYMPANLHDQIYAYVSHLPQLIAFTAPFSSRLVNSNIDLWTDIFLANAVYINEALNDFITFAIQIIGELSEGENDREGDANMLFPSLVASCLIATASLLQERIGVHPAHYAGTGFATMTAPAAENPEALLEAVSKYPHQVANMFNDLVLKLQRIQGSIMQGDRKALKTLLS
jgi:prephenate dehydrogenase